MAFTVQYLKLESQKDQNWLQGVGPNHKHIWTGAFLSNPSSRTKFHYLLLASLSNNLQCSWITQLNFSSWIIIMPRYKIWIPPTSGCYQNHNHRNSCKHRLKSKYHTVATFQISHVKSQVVFRQLLFLPEAWTSTTTLTSSLKTRKAQIMCYSCSCTLTGTDLGFTQHRSRCSSQ